MSTAPTPRKLKKGDHVFLIDGSSFIFRAYFAMFKAAQSRGRNFTRSDGMPTGAVFTFCNMLWKLLREGLNGVMPTHMAVVFDHSGTSFRNQIFADYKGHRPEPPDELVPQFPLMREAVRAFGLIPIEQEGFEADDLIATYARVALEAGADVSIIAGDKDLMQLVRPGIMMFDPMPGNERRIGAEEVAEKFGVPPEKVPDVQALIGDTTDNVPGVPGIGVKTAAQLINEYGDLETLLARASEIKQEKRRQSLIEFAEQARMSKRLVLLDDHIELKCPLENLPLDGRDPRKLIAFLKAMEFTNLTKRVGEATGVDPNAIDPDPALRADRAETIASEPGPAASVSEEAPAATPAAAARQLSLALPPVASDRKRPAGLRAEPTTPLGLVRQRMAEISGRKIDRSGYQAIRDANGLQRWIAQATDRGAVAIDLVTTSTDPMIAALIGVSLALAPNQAAYVPLGHRNSNDLLAGGGLADGQVPEHEALALLKPMLEDAGVLKVGHDLKHDALVLDRHGISLKSFDDVMLMSYVLDAGRSGHGLEELSRRHLGHTMLNMADVVGKGRTLAPFETVEVARACAICAETADVLLRVWRLLSARLVAERVATVYQTLERPLVPVLARMERRGIAIDSEVLSRLSGDFAQKAAALEAEIHEIAGEPLNPGSPKQIADILFGKMKLPGGRKTKTGAWSTSASVLDDLAEEGHLLPTKILEWRQISKLRSTYTDLLPSFVNPDTGRVHTNFALASTSTGRLSSFDPNLQNIPIRTEEGRKIRRAFIAAPGTKLISADYSQIELRLLAEIADIPALKRAFREGTDIHAMTASEMFNVPVKDMPGEVRRRAKAINFGIIYGISAFGLANQLGISREEAGAYIKKYFERFPGIRAFMDTTKEACRQSGYVTTLFGRKCHYPDINASNPSIRSFNERAAVNARLQGTAADIIRRAMVRMDEALARERLAAQMLLQVHDELVFQAPENEIDRTIPVVKRVMEEAPLPAVALTVPLHVDAHAADNWEEAH
ncbi:MAG TPA: DNA polymerase I [Xanthobacteraceae bacterium]|jgi:DNA polymerase-1|nr:DNA polymerase I [Xanthobacteraceae bacterium]